MKKILTFAIIFNFVALTNVFAQLQKQTEIIKEPIKIEASPEVEEYHAKGLLHQIYLEERAKSLEGLEYEKDGEPLKGKLSEDGKRIIIENYHKRGRVKVTVTTPTGEQKTVSKSSCYIDVVIPL